MPSKSRIVSVFDKAAYQFNTKALPKDRTNTFIDKNGKQRRSNTSKTSYFEKTIINNATAFQHPFKNPLLGDLSMQLNIRFPDFRHGDIDNLEKSICDGMQKVAFQNDNQIKAMHCDLYFGGTYAIEVILQPWRPRKWEERSSGLYLPREMDRNHSAAAVSCCPCNCCPHLPLDF